MKAANSLKADNYRKSGSHATCCRACEHFVDNGPYRRLCRIHQLGPASAYSGAVTPTVAAYNICDKFMPKLRECPFCGGPAIMREFGRHIDPYTGQHTPDIRIGCAAAFTARGDFGDDHARCPVAPMIHQLSYPGQDIVAAWNRRAGEEAK